MPRLVDLLPFACAFTLALGALSPGDARAEASAPSAEDRGAARRLLEAGKEAFRAARFEDAAKLFAEAYAKDPALDAALFNQAYALRRAERYAEARDAYRRYLERHPDDLDTHYALGRTAQLLGDDEDARRWYASYVEKETRAERARYVEHAKAQLRLLTPTTPKAPEPPAVVEEKPTPPPYDAAARFAEAMQRYQQKRYREAAALFLEVYEHDATRTKALYRHALALRQAGDLDAARAAYERFLAAEPSDADGVFGLAETERAAGNAERAIGLYERYLEVEKRPSEEPWRVRAREYIALLRASLAAPPDTEPAAVAEQAATPAASEEAPAESPTPEPAAEPAVESTVEAAPEPAAVASAAYGPSDAHHPRLVRVAALAPVEREEEAPAPPSLEALLEEGEAALEKKDAATALQRFQRAHAVAPSLARPHWGLARAYELAGQTSAAKHHYRLYRERPAADRDEAKADTAWWKLETLP